MAKYAPIKAKRRGSNLNVRRFVLIQKSFGCHGNASFIIFIFFSPHLRCRSKKQTQLAQFGDIISMIQNQDPAG